MTEREEGRERGVVVARPCVVSPLLHTPPPPPSELTRSTARDCCREKSVTSRDQ